ncbi:MULTISPECIES: Zn-ribbon domain-containing OB-fold protein [Gordonia]|uniref:OB-fold domain-containing protein n=1 Tax=Gordonia rubripertincta TaxID=36822 RepID=A0AAW4G0X0_GORRU|nr:MULTISPECIES: OB-fold nucleic acid binding domain-containing protein [Gordonia]MBM7276826.1 OB-fold domain-containing protein [Gordonia rubripertincta]MDH3008939.1 OB-fold domain-containing protein [Gordonia alkanivorans]MDH3012464.1 OB-fold domain-containing protein [Gordonia alkanivorans]MDH3017900.1 OB-fold domain-containing protein [Gordonia alkanivorans]MDH3043270.1 OB-fold domain-containing protein [Gordonia alkanivorans]
MSVTSPAAGNPIASPVATVPEPKSPILTAPLINSFDYTRSLGPVLSQFALALRDGRIVGSKGSDGKVSVPPVEFDPVTGQQSTEIVEVSTVGTVTSWTWHDDPVPGQPLDKPFAWALIKLDGADTALLHAVSVDSPSDISTGQRVHAVFSAARIGRIDDIAHFAPGESTDAAPENTAEAPKGADTGLVVIPTPVRTEITHSANEEESVYLEGLKAGKLIGTRIGSGVDEGRVYFPPRGVSPADGAPAVERVELAHTGIVTTFCIVNVPFQGQRIKPPYVAAYVLLDGADIPFLHLILDCEAADVRMGMRVKAVWLPEDEWEHSIGNISHFAPTGEPDAEYETYKDHL